MWSICPECNTSGGCDCFVGTGGRFRIRDHKKEQERHLQDLIDEFTPKYKPKKRKDEKSNN